MHAARVHARCTAVGRQMPDLPRLVPCAQRTLNAQVWGSSGGETETVMSGLTAPFGDHDAWRADPRKPSNGPRTQAARSGES